MRVHRGQAFADADTLGYVVDDLDAGTARGGYSAWGVECSWDVAEIFADERERWRHLAK